MLNLIVSVPSLSILSLVESALEWTVKHQKSATVTTVQKHL